MSVGFGGVRSTSFNLDESQLNMEELNRDVGEVSDMEAYKYTDNEQETKISMIVPPDNKIVTILLSTTHQGKVFKSLLMTEGMQPVAAYEYVIQSESPSSMFVYSVKTFSEQESGNFPVSQDDTDFSQSQQIVQGYRALILYRLVLQAYNSGLLDTTSKLALLSSLGNDPLVPPAEYERFGFSKVDFGERGVVYWCSVGSFFAFYSSIYETANAIDVDRYKAGSVSFLIRNFEREFGAWEHGAHRSLHKRYIAKHLKHASTVPEITAAEGRYLDVLVKAKEVAVREYGNDDERRKQRFRELVLAEIVRSGAISHAHAGLDYSHLKPTRAAMGRRTMVQWNPQPPTPPPVVEDDDFGRPFPLSPVISPEHSPPRQQLDQGDWYQPNNDDDDNSVPPPRPVIDITSESDDDIRVELSDSPPPAPLVRRSGRAPRQRKIADMVSWDGVKLQGSAYYFK